MSVAADIARKPRRFWRRMRVYFRRFRIFIWLVILSLLGAVIYLNQVGLPSFLKEPLLQRLSARGIDLQFSRLRLRWYEGLVAENVRFGRSTAGASPKITAEQAKVLLNWRSLLKGQAQVDSLVVRGGTIVLPVVDTNQPGRNLVVSNIHTQLRLLPGDQWLLDQLQANFASARLRATAGVKNASAVRDWPIFKGKPSKGRGGQKLKVFADTLEKIRFASAPEIELDLRGDATDPRSFVAHLTVNTPAAETPWGNVTNGLFKIRLQPSKDAKDYTAAIDLDAQAGSTPWGSFEDFKLGIGLAQPTNLTNAVQGNLRLTGRRARTRWAAAEAILADLQWVHAVTNPVPLWGAGKVVCTNAESRWASAGNLVFTGELSSTNAVGQSAGADWMWWTNLQPYAVRWNCQVETGKSRNIEVRRADLSGSWSSPRLIVSSASADMYDGKLLAKGSLDVSSREAEASASLDFDIRNVEQILTEGARLWIGQYQWKKPPQAEVEGKVILPAWTNRQPDWRAEVLPTLWLSGRFEAKNGAGYKGLDADRASSHFIYSNMTWHLPDLVVVRPEGRLEAEHIANDRTKQYSWKIHSTVDPSLIRPLLKTNETRVFELLKLGGPPEIVAEVWGTFHRYDLLGAHARVIATNFSFRGQSGDRLEAEVFYTNKLIQVFHPVLLRGEETAKADAVTVDLNAQQVYITNAVAAADPLAFARAIGPKVGRTMENYLFLHPPKTRVNGTVPMHGEIGADLKFEVDGGPFHWWKLKIPQISGVVHWKDYQLSLSGVEADFYWGKARGNAVFDLSPHVPGTEFMFSMNGTNVLLQALLADLTTSTNKSEGWVDGTIVITGANSSNWRSVQGHGELRFHDGLLWDIPLFGVLSPVLDGLVPGLGSSRATAGTCSYIMTNGVFRTSDMDIRTPTMRLQYRGDVDLANDYELKARVEAELLKDMWVVGPLVSTVFWPVTKLFEYKVGGTLSQPKLEPVNVIPKIMLMPFYPLRALKGLTSEPAKPEQQKNQEPALNNGGAGK